MEAAPRAHLATSRDHNDPYWRRCGCDVAFTTRLETIGPYLLPQPAITAERTSVISSTA